MNSIRIKHAFLPSFLVAFLFMSFAAPAFAESPGDPPGKKKKGHHSHVAVFFGTASVDGHTDFSLGSDFEYKFAGLNDKVGIGAIADAVFAKHTHVMAAGGLFVHPVGGLKLLAAPGATFDHGHNAFVFRTGMSYELHVDQFSIAPTLNFDFSEGHTTSLLGIAIGASL